MMNADSSAQCNQKDFCNAYTQADQLPHSLTSSQTHTPSLQEIFDMNGLNMHSNNQNVGMDVLDNLMANASSNSNSSSSMPAPAVTGPQPSQQALIEQQMKLNQLQQLYQLQTQIFQQQIELLSGQASFGTLSLGMMVDQSRARDQQYLPTPGPSANLQPQQSPDFVPPMILPSQASPQVTPYNQPTSYIQNQLQSQLSGPHGQHGTMSSGPHSAPANIVFPNIHGPLGGGSGSNMNSPYGPLPSPGDPEFDEMSPLTSPWLGAYNATSSAGTPVPNSTQNQQQNLIDQSVLQSSSTIGMKRRTRTASPGSDEASSSRGRAPRKRQSAAIRLPPPHSAQSHKKATNSLRGGTKSANSTPVFPSTHGPIPLSANRPNTRRSAAAANSDIPGDSPSPVDLSMPPPAAPPTSQQTQLEFLLNSGDQAPVGEAQTETNEQPILPVTPSSIMNLGRLGTQSSLTPPASKPAKKPTRMRSATTTSNIAGERTLLISPALKPIRPASNASNVQGLNSPVGPSSTTSVQGQQPPLQVRKTSHKAAEQKRRDSLKSSFDDLRVLLPPIPLPSEEGFLDEPILPGAMPPRGPPKGNVDGPNRGVSKLQLLRCGNDYIRRLKGRVERRDMEIDILRKEIGRLRLSMGSHLEMDEEGECVELDKDLDACEAALGPLGRGSNGGMDGDEVDDDGGD